MEPGGDYWDTAFLRAALESLNNRGEGQLLDSLALGAYVWTEDRSMTWGAGGPESWPATMPYHTPQGSEDQRGFRIFDWYNAISEAALGKQLPIIIVAAGVQRESGKALDARVGTRAIKMAQTLARPADPDKNNAVPANVLACNFWLLSAASGSSIYKSAWFKSQNGKPTKAGEEWLNWHIGATGTKTIFDQVGTTAPPIGPAHKTVQSVSHYLLLPDDIQWPMEAVRTFMQEHGATVGTSQTQAAQAARVTLAGGLDAFADDVLRTLIQAGCTVDYMKMDLG